MMKEGKELSGLLGYQLQMFQLSAQALAREALSRHEISPARVTALLLIRANQGCTQTALGEVLSVNRSSAMKLVNYLEGRGLVRREAGADLRANALQLTPEGETLVEEFLAALRQADEKMRDALTEEEGRTLIALLAKARSGVDRGQDQDG
ncbi:MAG: MarR family winged helix-turn-helix transcriptional regulator [Sphingobium sp.]